MGTPWIQDYNRTVPSGTPPSGGLRYQLANPQADAYVFIYSSPTSTGNITVTIRNAEGHPSPPYTVVPGGLLNQGPTGVSYVDVSGSGNIVTVIIADSETTINAALLSTSVTISAFPALTTRSPLDLTASITTGGTAQKITTTSTPCRKFIIANTSGTDTVKVGASTPNIPILAGGVFILEANGDVDQFDLSGWYFVGATAGDSIAVTYL